MHHKRKAYYNNKWFDFAKKVKERDGYKCLHCERGTDTAVLQVHHEVYRSDLQLWEYPLSDCLTLCRGCHAETHKKILPRSNWILLQIDDLGSDDGICEKVGCGSNIRYEHLIYHPEGGYLTVGSTCVEYLTEEFQIISKDRISLLKKVSDFVSNSHWEEGQTQKGHFFVASKFNHNEIRIYESKYGFAYQIAQKHKGEKKLEFHKTKQVYCRRVEQVKELSIVHLRALLSNDEKEREILRDFYKIALKSMN